MSTVYFGLGLLTGIFLGVGFAIFYMRWRIGKHLTGMQEQMENMMEITSEMDIEEHKEED